MKISKIIIVGTFSFPEGEAASARILDMCKGLLSREDILEVSVISIFGLGNRKVQVIHHEGKAVKFQSFTEYIFAGTNTLDRLKSRMYHFLGQSFLIKELRNQLSGDSSELIILYSRSYLMLNKVFKLVRKKNWSTKLAYDIVEPPQAIAGLRYFLKHPFSLDAQLCYRPSVLNRLDLVLFISKSLEEKYSSFCKKSMLLPSIKDYQEETQVSQRIGFDLNESVRIGYLGSLIRKDNPELLFNFAEHLDHIGVDFKLVIVGRSRFFDEGKKWISMFENATFSDRIIFKHNPSDEERNEILKQLDFLTLFRFPDQLQKDTFPTRIVELLKFNRPIILNRFGDLAYYFKHKLNCFELKPDNLPTRDEWISWMEASTTQRVVNGGRDLLRKNFNATIKMSQLLQALD